MNVLLGQMVRCAVLVNIMILGLTGNAMSQATMSQSPASHPGGPPVRIVAFGDSLTAGYGLADPSSESYPALIQAKISAAKLGWRVVNAGLSGETTAGGLRRIDWILRQPVDLLVLALGGNDGLRGTAPAATRANLQQIIDRVRAQRTPTRPSRAHAWRCR